MALLTGSPGVARLITLLTLVLAPLLTPLGVGGRAVSGGPSPGQASRRVIVRLSGAPLSRLTAGRVPGRSLDLYTTDSVQRLAQIRDAQQRLSLAIEQTLPGSSVEHRYQLTFNGLAVRLPEGAAKAQAVATLRSLPGVSAVYEETAFRPALYSSVPAIGAPALWDGLGGMANAGAGVKIAVLDSGIDTAHPMFSEAAFSYPAGFPKGDTRYATPKVIAARAYFRPANPPLSGEETPRPGLLGSGHGTHVAGIAAGNPVTATYRGLSQQIVGVAPRAWLMNYRIFYPTDNTGQEVAFSAEILQAIEDAVSDGANVICNSWSSATPALPFASPEVEALEGAIEAGCVVVASSGNEGPGYGSASRVPGGMEKAITVGSVSKDHVVAYDLVDVADPEPTGGNLHGQPFARALFGRQISSVFGPFPCQNVARVDPEESPLACQPLPDGSLTGRIAVIARGECDFADKAYYVQQAGALLALIYDSTDGPVAMSCGGTHCTPGEIFIPAVMVSQSFGQDLLDWLIGHPSAALRLDPQGRIVSATANVVQANSGRGPAYMRFLKPDVMAPGVLVLSAYHDQSGSLPSYAQLSGTSMAAAHVAGAAALLLQEHPTWNHDDVKAALMGTAYAAGIADPLSSAPARVLAYGAGLIRVSKAAAPGLLLSPPSLPLPHGQPGQQYQLQVSALSVDDTAVAVVYALSVEVSPTSSLSVSVPSRVVVGQGESVQIPLTVEVQAGAQAGDAEATLRLANAEHELQLPIWVHIEPRSTADVLVIDNDFSFFDAFTDYASYVTDALGDAGHSFVVWGADERYGNPQSIPDLEYLQEFPIVLWFTGDNLHPDGYFAVETPLTPQDMHILASYLDGGGRIMAFGQNLAEASDVNPGLDPAWDRASFYHHLLGAHWLQTDLFGPSGQDLPPSAIPALTGLPGAFLADAQLDLGAIGDGAHNQTSVDEIAPGGVRDGSDRDLVQPLLRAVVTTAVSSGYAAIAKTCEPTLENDQPACAYRSLYYAFGLEGVNDGPGMTSRVELVGRSIDWLTDRVNVTLGTAVGSANDLVQIHCQATSSVGAKIISFRWRTGKGSEARIAQSDKPTVSFIFPARGRYPIAVEVTDALGHKAVAHSEVFIVEGGSSTLAASRSVASPGDEVTYRVVARNTGSQAISVTFSLPLPAGTQYIAHNGGDFQDNALTWSGSVARGADHGAELAVRVVPDLMTHDGITATAQFRAGDDSFVRTVFVRTVHTVAVSALYVPLVLKGPE